MRAARVYGMRVMKTGAIIFMGILLAAVAGLSACGEELYDDAKRALDGYPVAAVLVYDNGSAKIIITDGGDYFREIGVYTMAAAPTVTLPVLMHRSGALFVAEGSRVHVNTGRGWIVTEPVLETPVLGLASNGDGVMALSGTILCEFQDDGSTSWRQEMNLSTVIVSPYTAQTITNVGNREDAIIVASDTGSVALYSSGDMATPLVTLPVPVATFFDENDGIYYAGGGTTLMTSSGKVYSSATLTINSFAVLDRSTLFAGGHDTAPASYVYRLNPDTVSYEQYQPLASSAATVFLGALDRNRLIVGLRDSADNGIFIFDYVTKSTRKIYSSAVYGLHVMRP